MSILSDARYNPSEKMVLVVDDEPHIVRLVEVNLQRAGYQVITASSGAEALEKISDEKPDLVTLDILMPEMDGFEVLRSIRSHPSTEDLPVVILSQLARHEDVFKGWQEGCNSYVAKPFNPRELLGFIERIFNSQVEESEKEGR